MTKKEKKRKILTYSVMVLLILGIFSIMNGDSLKWLGVLCFGLGIIALLINSIGTIYYAKGSKFLQSSNPDISKALPYLEKAVKRGTDPHSEILAATLFIQYGDMEKGRTVLEEYIDSSDKKINAQSRVSLSMYYWTKRDLDKALVLAEGVYKTGYKDRNLYVNLLTYYLEKGMYKEFEKLLKESKKVGLNLPAILDLEASYAMSRSDWATCGAKLKKLFELTLPGFIDPYLHKAVLSLHYGKWENAVKTLKDIKNNVTLTNTSIYDEAQIDTLRAYIEDKDTRWGFLKAVENDPTLLIRRVLPQIEKGCQMPLQFPQEPDYTKIEEETTEEKNEGDIDTSLTEEDEAWLKKHQ